MPLPPLDSLAQGAAKAASLGSEYLFFMGASGLALLRVQARRWITGALVFGLGLLWLAYHLPVSLYLDSLGVDSFAETRQFDGQEAWFWLQTLDSAIQPVFSAKKLIVYLLLSWAGFQLLMKLLQACPLSPRLRQWLKPCVPVTLMLVAIQMTASSALAAYLGNSELFLSAARNFDHEAPAVEAGPSHAHLVVYIGESTSAMNMGLYGYPRPTTPRLGERARTDRNLVVLRHVFSTHTHTTGSLLEALSFALEPGQEFLPIQQRQRLGVVDVLHQAGFETLLLSNQCLDGSWSQASSVIFRKARRVFRVERQDLGHPVAAARARWDDEFFARELDALDLQSPRARRLAVFLHSYAGHGRYDANIPERFRHPVDASLAHVDRRQVLEDPTLSLDSLETYDAAIRYVDYSVERIIRRVQQSPQPIILVYFSDHGDAAFSARGHDSARFKHEMARVPLLVYFNNAARRDNPALFARYRRLAQSQAAATLAQLPSTLLDLVGLKPRPAPGQASGQALMMTPVLGEMTRLPPILVRQTPEGTTYMDLNEPPWTRPSHPGQRLTDKTDADTRTFVELQAGRRSREQVCHEAGSSLEARSRSILVADCPHAGGVL